MKAMKLSLLAAAMFAGTCAMAAQTRAEQTMLTGVAAIAKFPERLRDSDIAKIEDAAWCELMPGVEYFYGKFTKLYAMGKEDISIIRVDYKNANVRMKFVDGGGTTFSQRSPGGSGTQQTSAAAHKKTGLFGINLTQPDWYAKMEGKVIYNGQKNNGGLALCDDKSYEFFRNDAFAKEPKRWFADHPNGEGYTDVFCCEAVGFINGNYLLGGEMKASPGSSNPYTGLGEAADNVLYLCVIDGRTNRSTGTSYGDMCRFLGEFGCFNSMCLDGGGSTTMVISKALIGYGVNEVQHQDSVYGDHWIMNHPSDGSERKVCNQLVFVEGGAETVEITPVEIDKPAAVTGLVYTGKIQEGVIDGRGFTLTGEVATNAGAYVATAKLVRGYVWSDKTTADVKINWSIAKATPTPGNVTASAITFGQTLAASTLTRTSGLAGTFRWADPTIVPTIADSNKTEYDVIFEPEDSTNYTTASKKAKVTVTLGKPTVNEVTVTPITYGQKLSASTITGSAEQEGTFSWKSPNTVPTVADSEVTEYDVVFKPTDTATYASLTIRVKIVVNRVEIAVPQAKEYLSFTGAELTGVEPGSGYSLTDNTATEVGDYVAIATLTDKANTCWAGRDGAVDDQAIAWKIAPAAPVVSDVRVTAITYGQPLSASAITGSSETEGTFRWQNPTIVPTVADSGKTAYGVVFDPTDATKFSPALVMVTLVVNRFEIAVPTAKEGLTFNFSEQTGVEAGEGYALSGETATEAGEHVATASLTDKANTCWAGMSGSFADQEIVWTIAPRMAEVAGSAEAGTDYNGSAVAFDVSNLDIGSHAFDELKASFEVNGKAYAGVVAATGGTGYRVTFDVDAAGANAVVASNAYAGAFSLWLEKDDVRTDVVSDVQSLTQGRLNTDTNGWFRETAATCGQSGTWTCSSGPVALETDGGFIQFDTAGSSPYEFEPTKSMVSQTKGVIDVSVVYDAPGEEDDTPPAEDARCGARIVEDDETGAIKLQVYAALPDGQDGWTVGWHDWNQPRANGYVFVRGGEYGIRLICDFETGSRGLVCAVRAPGATDYVPLFAGYLTDVAATGMPETLSSIGFSGKASISLLQGECTRDFIDANLASVNGREYATVADAVEAANGAPITLLHRASWKPNSAEEEKSAVFVNPDWLVLDSAQPEIFDAGRIGVCSWSWHDDMTSILARMRKGGFKGMQLALSPWIWDEGEATEAQKETFGDLEGDEVLELIRSEAEKTNIVIHATMIAFADEDYTSTTTISNTCGLFYGLAPSATDEQRANAESKWAHRSNQFERAAILTGELDVPYLTAHLGLSGLDDAAKGYPRLSWACKVCKDNGCKLLIETGMYSAEDTAALLTKLVQAHPELEGWVGLNFDSANQILYGADTPTRAFPILRQWIDQVHIKDCVEDPALRGGWATDVEWGLGDVSTKYDFISFLRTSGFTGPLLVEHESGEATADARAKEILTAVQALLVSNNADDPECTTPDWINPALMEGDTPAEKSAAAMKAQGFDEGSAAAVAEAGAGAYGTVSEWSQAWADGWQTRGEAKKPMPSDIAAIPGVLTSAAIGADAPLAEEDVKIMELEPSADGSVTVKVSLGEYQNLKGGNEALLKAALGVTGAYGLGGGESFSADNVDVTAKEVGAAAVELKATPKPVGGQAPGRFFFRATAR